MYPTVGTSANQALLGTDIRAIDVEPAIVVVIPKRCAHPRSVGRRAGFHRQVRKRTVPVVVVIGIPVVVVIAEYGYKAEAGVSPASLLNHVREGPIPIVVK